MLLLCVGWFFSFGLSSSSFNIYILFYFCCPLFFFFLFIYYLLLFLGTTLFLFLGRGEGRRAQFCRLWTVHTANAMQGERVGGGRGEEFFSHMFWEKVNLHVYNLFK
jgi:hypothetical protein